MRKALFLCLLLCITVGVPALSAYVGHRLTYLRMRKKPWQVNSLVAEQVRRWQCNETLAGAFELAGVPLDGVERCYYEPPDFHRVGWCCRDMPTPFVGYAPQPGEGVCGRINGLQFRCDHELIRPKPPGVCRIFVVGGSTAFGAGASSTQRTVAGYLQQQLQARKDADRMPGPGSAGNHERRHANTLWLFREVLRRSQTVEVITAATSGWTSTHERIFIENRLTELEPDLVISLSGHNDAFFGSFGKNVLWSRGFQDDYYFLLANSLLSCNFDAAFPADDPGKESGVDADVMARRLLHNVRLACAALEPTGAAYVWSLQPILAASRKPLTPRERKMAERARQERLLPVYQAFRQELGRFQRQGFLFLDLTDVFDHLDGQTEVFIDGCHFGDRGNDLIARALADRILAEEPPSRTKASLSGDAP
ncbi:MAG: SGNH/GDSL hydrolase family protein [Gemmatales bacterium]|nr:SGNH/GDSL hydrolase family protein [Gemmatales bacterium]MDW8387615.1 GDSL-type esterase/lipase family protein [Gemmatales bacterium]